MSNEEATLGYLNQQAAILKKRMAGLEHKFNTLDSVVLDEASHREALSVVVIDRVDRLTQEMQMERLRAERGQDRADEIALHKQVKTRKRLQRMAFIDEIKQQQALTRRTLKSPCSCGKHYSLAFYDGRKKAYEMCPMEWWRLSSHVANFEGWLSEFLKEHSWDDVNSKNLLENK